MKIILFLIILILPPVSALDFSIQTTIDNKISRSEPQSSLFKVLREDYKTGSEAVPLNITYNITKENILISKESVEIEVKKSKTKGIGKLYLNQSGEYTLCGKILQTDDKLKNNIGCTTFFVIEEKKLSQDLFININVKNLSKKELEAYIIRLVPKNQAEKLVYESKNNRIINFLPKFIIIILSLITIINFLKNRSDSNTQPAD